MTEESGNPRMPARAGVNIPVRPLSLRIYPDEVLRDRCEPVARYDLWLRDVLDEMLTLMRQSRGIGLAAPQVGISERFFVAEIEDRVLQMMNPSINTHAGGDQMIEGCLSLPGMRVDMHRAERIEVISYDRRGKRQSDVFQGLWARVVQHEIDHLNGILICDYTNTETHDEVVNR